MQYLFLILITLLFCACNSKLKNLSFKDNRSSITFYANGEMHTLQTAQKRLYEGGGCLQRGVHYSAEDFQLDFAKPSWSCDWAGFPDSIYKSFLLQNIKSFSTKDKRALSNGDIYTLEKNGDIFYFISLYDLDSYIFIIDYTGDIASKIVKENLKIALDKQLQIRVDKEFLRNQQFKHYFEREDREKRRIIFQN